MRRATVRKAWWASAAMFLLHGLVVSTWISRIPTIQLNLGLSNAVLGLTLLGTAVGSVLAIPICGWLVNRFGSKRVTTWVTVGFCFSLIPLAFAINAMTLALALFLFGAHAGTQDVSMNAQGVEVEKALGRPTMSRFHAMFSLGAMVGSGLGGAVAARHIDPVWHFFGAAVLFTLFSLIAAPMLLAGDHEEAGPHLPRLALHRIPARILILSAIAFCILLSEGAMADWTGVYLQQVLAAGPGTAATGYAVFSAAMAVFRFLGDSITVRLGSVMAVRIGSLVGAGGILWAILAPSAAWALPGFAATGAGFSVIVPLVFGSGGRVEGVSPGTGIAMVTGLGYVGFLVGPPAIGFVSEALTLRYALGLLIGLCLLCSFLSGAIGGTDAGRRRQAA